MSYQTITISYVNGGVVCTPNPAPATGHISAPVHADHHVQWVAGDGVISINSITLSPSPGIFSELPTSANNWTGLVSPNAVVGQDDSYSGVVLTSDGVKDFDPKLKVDQTPPPPVLK